MKRILAALLLLATGSVASAASSYSVPPAHPTTAETIFISKVNGNEDNVAVSIAGNRITVKLRSLLIHFDPPQPGNVIFPIGRYPEGTYTVDVLTTGGASLGTTSVTVGPRPSGLAADDYSDLWWNPEESGWGLNIAQHPDGQIFATWFVYAADGSPTWYVVPGGKWLGDGAFHGDVYRTTGPADMTHFSPDAVTRTKAGSADFNFGPAGLLVDITVDGKQVKRLLQRQSF